MSCYADAVRFRFANAKLEKLYETGKGARHFSRAVVDSFMELVAVIHAARNERDFYALKSLHYEKLQGRRAHQRSMRVNKQFRLIVELEIDHEGHLVALIDIEDYH
jgi:proteic killer suppression protein